MTGRHASGTGPGAVPTLVTQGLILRPLAAADGSSIVAGLNQWQVVRWLSVPPYPYVAADAEWFIHHAPGLHWAIAPGRDRGLIGVISVQPELGYWLDPVWQGQGLMIEAAQAVLDWHFQSHDAPVSSGHHFGNDASRAVLLKLGFRGAGTETHFSRPRGEDVEVQCMILTRSDWQARDG